MKQTIDRGYEWLNNDSSKWSLISNISSFLLSVISEWSYEKDVEVKKLKIEPGAILFIIADRYWKENNDIYVSYSDNGKSVKFYLNWNEFWTLSYKRDWKNYRFFYEWFCCRKLRKLVKTTISDKIDV